ncbi:hypothetical protein B7494_g1692 [Chlorociboria aeruginascens]|nr:hypothetical protein B7494_g1692 [Chlorociboria aeruginascens]
MENPESKIQNLLENVEYRKRVVNLFEQQKDSKKPKILYVATTLIACGQLSFNRVKEDDQRLEEMISDPTKTVPAKIGAKTYRVKHNTLQGTYQSDVVLCMGYHSLKYEREKTDAPSFLAHLVPFRGNQKLLHSNLAHRFTRPDGDNDVFWIRYSPPKGTTIPLMSKTNSALGDSPPRSPEIPQGHIISEGECIYSKVGNAGLNADPYKPGFFGESDYEEEE